MHVVIVRFRVKEQHAAAFVGRLRRQAQDSLDLEPACRRFDVLLDPNDPGGACLYEMYDDEAAFDMHLKTRHFLGFDTETRPWIDQKIVERWELRDAPARRRDTWLAQ